MNTSSSAVVTSHFPYMWSCSKSALIMTVVPLCLVEFSWLLINGKFIWSYTLYTSNTFWAWKYIISLCIMLWR